MLDAHPAIGQKKKLSKHSKAEQGADYDPAVIAELLRLNAEYEARHGFRFVVFVNRRPKTGDPRGAAEPDRQPDGRGARDGAARARRDRDRQMAARVTRGAFLDPYVTDWLNLLLRWLHVIAAMAWIGASFYFVLLDQSLREPKSKDDIRDGVGGELWEVHGGGFYHVKKYKVAPPVLPDHLAWFKWEAYTTWLSGFALMVVLYYFNASAYLIDPSVADLSLVGGGRDQHRAARRSVARLRRPLPAARRPRRRVLWTLILVLTTIAAWGCIQLFQPRAAFLQVGAMLGTIMAGNVFFNIIPAHWELINAKKAGREPDPTPGIVAKQRSVHNNYFTLPVLFTMLAGHFAFVYGAARAWLVLILIMLLGVLARVFFNLRHQGRTIWALPVVGGRRA